jgi:iron complex outermembrane receptor protein
VSRHHEITFDGKSNIIIAGQRLKYIGGKSMQLNSVKTKTILLVSTMLLPPGILLPGQAVAQTRPVPQASAPVPPEKDAPVASAEDAETAPAAQAVDDRKGDDPKAADQQGGDQQGSDRQGGDQKAADQKAVAESAPDEPQPVRLTPNRKAEAASDGSIVVTGSRIGGYDPTSDVKVYTQDDIKALGVSNVQDFIRSLPQNQASVGYGLNNRSRTANQDAHGLGGLGVAGVNLRGLGTKNTLVLVNGRRIAGAAGIEDGFANINTIPLAAVDRVEVSLGGGSAVYGADAMAGVVNFILKKHYEGYSATVRHENSSTGANTTQATYLASTSWGSGSITGTLSLTQIDPAENLRLGYVTHDYRRYITPEQMAAVGLSHYPLDQRSSYDGAQPGAIHLQYTVPGKDGGPNDYVFDVYQWRPGGDMTHPTFAGVGPINRDTIAPNIPVDAGEHQRSGGLSFNIEQKLTDRLHVTVDYLGAIYKSNLRELWQRIEIAVPFGQAYNPIKRSDLPADAKVGPGVAVYYYPKAEYEDGRMRRGFQESTIRSHSVTGGLRYDIDRETALYANYSYSRNTATGTQRGIQNLTGTDKQGKCGANTGNVTAPNLAEIVAAQCAAINSSDPALAFNFLDDGTGKLGAPASIFFATTERLANSASQQNGDILLTAVPLSLPAGKLRLAAGGETRTNSVTSPRLRERTAEALNSRLWAAYAELRVSVIAETMNVPLFRTFDLSFKGRYDRYDSRGPVGTIDDVPYSEGGKLIRGKAIFDRISPDASLAWTPLPGLLLKAGWSSNFTPPPFTALYNVSAGSVGETYLWKDPLSPGNDPFYFYGLPIPMETQANPLLKPAVSRNYHIGGLLTPPGFLHNLNLQVDYYRTRIRNRTGLSTELIYLLSAKEYYGLNEFFVRDEYGKIARQILKPINIGWDLSESIDVELSYAIPTRFGLITPSIFYTRNLKQLTSYAGRETQISSIGTSDGLDKYRIIGNLDFTRRDLMARLTVRYTPPYKNTFALAIDEGDYQDSDNDGVKDKPIPIGSLTTFDFTTRWQVTQRLTLSAGGRNVLNAKPPFALIDRRPFDASRYDLRGRVLYAEARVNL